MILSNYNTFTKKYYEYDTDEVDESSLMFNKDLHNNDIVIQWNYPHKNKCAYCNTTFQSRNKLFNHLGYMGIDIRTHGMDTEMDTDDIVYKQYCHEKKKKRNNKYWQRKYTWNSTWKYKKQNKIQKRQKKSEVSSLSLSMAMFNLS